MKAKTTAPDRLRLLEEAASFLRQSGVDNSRVDAELLLRDTLGCSRPELYLEDGPLSGRDEDLFRRRLTRRAAGEPLQYILGHTEFMGYLFRAREGVFIPRPETELLVEEALRRLPRDKRKGCFIIEVGTGCGAIALSLTLLYPGCKIKAVDSSADAVALARENARLLGVENDVDFVVADLFPPAVPPAEMVISNPPYVPRRELAALPREVRHEPAAALDGGEDGTELHLRIIARANKALAPGGWLIMELGYDQAGILEAAVKETPGLTWEGVSRDYTGRQRIMTARRG